MPRRIPAPIGDMDLVRLLWEIPRFWRAAIDRRLKPLGLSDARWRTVLCLAHGPSEMSQVDLATRMSIEAPTMARILDRLAADGWIERRASARDRRIKTVHLLPRAAEALQQIERTMREARDEVLSGLPHPELQACIAVLHTIRDRAEQAARAEYSKPE